MALIGREQLEEAIDEKVMILNNKLIGVYMNGLTDMALITPTHFKDGGRLAGGWRFTTSNPATASASTSGQSGASASIATLSRMPKVVIGKKVYYTNVMPYANVVEYGGYPNPPENGTWTGEKYEKLSSGGYSRQAPSGMVRVTLTKMEARIRAL